MPEIFFCLFVVVFSLSKWKELKGKCQDFNTSDLYEGGIFCYVGRGFE